MPRCKNCKELFKPKYFNQKYHLDKDECLKAMIQENREKETKRIIQKQKKEKSDWTKEKKERKEALMSHSEWLKLLQSVFNTYIRERDKGLECVSCGCKVDNGHASHFFSVGSHPNLRFDEDNVHLSCIECNLHLHGNLIEYGLRLPKRIGQKRYDALLNRSKKTTLKLSIPEVKNKIQEYKKEIKELKNGIWIENADKWIIENVLIDKSAPNFKNN